jgi:hypothetical protein
MFFRITSCSAAFAAQRDVCSERYLAIEKVYFPDSPGFSSSEVATSTPVHSLHPSIPLTGVECRLAQCDESILGWFLDVFDNKYVGQCFGRFQL